MGMARIATRPQSYAVEPLVMRALDKNACHVLVASATGLRLILPVQLALPVGRKRHSGVRYLFILCGRVAAMTFFATGAFLPVSRKLPFEIAIAYAQRFEQSRMATDAVVVLVVRPRLLRRAGPICARGPERRQSQRKKQHAQLPFRIHVYRSFPSYTTSTEQWARAATADETLPSRKRSIRPIPLAPTKMQSAPQLSASIISNRFGSSSFTTTSVLNPEARSLPTASSIILLTLAFSSAIHVMIGPSPRLEVIWGVAHVALTMRASLPAGHLRTATASTAASAPFEPSTPIINRTGVPGSSIRPRATRTERRASCNTFCETLPKKNRPSAVWPCDPSTIKSASHLSASSRIASLAEPLMIFVMISSPEAFPDSIRSTASLTAASACSLATLSNSE